MSSRAGQGQVQTDPRTAAGASGQDAALGQQQQQQQTAPCSSCAYAGVDAAAAGAAAAQLVAVPGLFPQQYMWDGLAPQCCRALILRGAL